MERLTKRSPDTTKENGVCCTHFGQAECIDVAGNCASGCIWEEAAWGRLADYEDTLMTPDQIRTARVIIDAAFADNLSIVERIRELLKADKDGRIRVLPAGESGTCGSCKNFVRTPGARSGTCEVRPYPRDRWGKEDRNREFRPSQSRISCKQYIPCNELEAK